MTDVAWLRDPFACVELVTRLAGVSLAISAAEWLVARNAWVDATVLGWPLLRQRSRLRGEGPVTPGLDRLLSASGFTGLQVARLLAGLALVLFPAHPVVRPLALWLGVVAAGLTNVRQFGLGVLGADRMRLAVLGALVLRELAPASAPVAQAVLWFIAGQCALAYGTSGVLKLTTPAWRSGEAIGWLLRQDLMGDRRLAAWLAAHPGANRLVTWSTLVLEIGFPLAWLVGGPVAAVFVGGVFLLHLGIGHFMGLAPFLWAFLACYPAVLFTSGGLRAWLGW